MPDAYNDQNVFDSHFFEQMQQFLSSAVLSIIVVAFHHYVLSI